MNWLQPEQTILKKNPQIVSFYIVQGKVYNKTELTIDQNKLNRVFAELVQSHKIDSLKQTLLKMQEEKRFDEINDYITSAAPYLEKVSGESLQKDNPLSPEQVEAYTTVGGSPHLDGAYTVFGRIIYGLEVIDKIAGTPTLPGDKPINEIYMTMEVMEMKKKKITKIYGYPY